jgi:hypothetical protein
MVIASSACLISFTLLHLLITTNPRYIPRKNTGQLAQQKRENARSLATDPKGWLLQGLCYCGLCGHILKCVRKRRQDHNYYACWGRIQHRVAQDCEERCNLLFIRADRLEWGVWAKVKEVLNDSDKLIECVSQALVELQERKSQIGSEILDVDGKLETLRKRMERLGMAFADGAIEENAYKSKLKQLKKQEVTLPF